MRPLRRDHFLDRGVAGEAVDRAVKIDVERNQPRQRGVLADGPAGLQRRFQRRAPGGVGLHASGGEPRRQRVDGAADLVELADAGRIEFGDLEATAAALGDQALPVQQMQRMGDRLARYAKLLGQLVLGDAQARRQRPIDDRLQDPGIDLVDQVGERIKRDHTGVQFGIRNSVFSMDTPGGRPGQGPSRMICRCNAGFPASLSAPGTAGSSAPARAKFTRAS